MENNRISVVYIADAGFMMPTCVSIVSLIKNKNIDDKYIIYALLNGVDEADKEKIVQLSTEDVEINIIDITSENYNGLDETTCVGWNRHITKSALYKFGLAEYLDNEDKILYIDGDTIINNSLRDLYNTDLEDNYVAAVNDMGRIVPQMAREINLKDENYFNSGVMLLNLKKMRQDKVFEKLIDYRVNTKSKFVDQDAFNYVMQDSRIILPCKYNFLIKATEEFDFDELCEKYFDDYYCSFSYLIKEQIVLHYAGPNKPWKFYNSYVTEMFLEYYYLSPYKDEHLQLKSIMRKMKHEVIVNKKRRNWSFPYEAIKKNSRIIVYGAGAVGTDIIYQNKFNEYCSVVLWVDRNYAAMKDEEISDPEKIFSLNDDDYDYVFIANSSDKAINEIAEYLLSNNVPEEKIVHY